MKKTIPRVLASLIAAAALVGCGEDHGPLLTWEFRFQGQSLQERSAWIEAEIIEGGCGSGKVLYWDGFPTTKIGALPPSLSDGRYGLRGRARDASCRWIAEGCVQIKPDGHNQTVVVSLEPMVATLDPSCNIVSDQNASSASDEPVRDPGVASGTPEPPDEGEDGGGASPADTPSPPSLGTDAGEPELDASTPEPVAPTPTPPPVCGKPKDDVLGCWDFEDDLRDASARARDASGAALFDVGIVGRALVGSASGQIRAPLPSSQASFTVEVWFRLNALGGRGGTSRGLLLDWSPMLQLGFSIDGQARARLFKERGGFESLDSSSNRVAAKRWQHIALRFQAQQNATVFVDGVQVASVGLGFALPADDTGTLTIGSAADGSEAFDGQIEAVRVTERALADAEIAASARIVKALP